MKSFNKKNILIIVLCLIIFGFILNSIFGGYISYTFDTLYSKITQWIQPDEPKSEGAYAEEVVAMDDYYSNSEAVDVARDCSRLYFYGDTGYMVKGQLLDNSASSVYNNLPDTLGFIRYGDQIEQVEQKNVQYYHKKARFKLLKSFGNNHPIKAYLRLAEQGKVEFLQLMPNKRGSLEVMEYCDFDSKYGEYFDANILWQRDIPLEIKDVLSEFFKSDVGSEYSLAQDRRKSENVCRIGSYTGINQYTKLPNRELAVVLTEKNSTGEIRERILVVSYDDHNQKAKLLYNEMYYTSKIIIETYAAPNAIPEEASSLRKYVTPSTQLIEIKNNSGNSVYLYYDEEFDTMIRNVFPSNNEYSECTEC